MTDKKIIEDRERSAVASRNYVQDCYDRLYRPELSDNEKLLKVIDWVETSDYRDYVRFSMYNMMVAQNLIAAVANKKMTEPQYQESLKKGGDRHGLEQMAAGIFFASKARYEQIHSVKVISAVRYDSDNVLRTQFWNADYNQESASVASRSYTEGCYSSLYRPPLPDDVEDMRVDEWVVTPSYRDYARFNMYHMLVAQNLIAAVANKRMTEKQYHASLKAGKTRNGIENMAAGIFFNSMAGYHDLHSVQMLEVVQDKAENALQKDIKPIH